MSSDERKYPEVGELVLIEVVKILPYGAFCKILDYDNLEAFLHISEISSGWIKNIHEHIDEGRKYVAKVSKVNVEKMLFDVSLKKVTEQEKKEKLEEIKKENRAKKIIELVCKNLNIDFNQLSSKITSIYQKHYSFLEEIANNKKDVLKKNFEEKFIDELEKIIISQEVKKIVTILKVYQIIGKGNNGITNVKNLFSSLLKDYKELQIKYLGSPRYMFIVKANDHKLAKKIIDEIEQKLFKEKATLIVKVEAEQK
ncbi:MAG: hypothetical protein QXJ06_02575 [Candidatus Aenigmatarchaeota archaeon]